MTHLSGFFQGYLYSVLATVIFAAFGWITVDRRNRWFVIPLLSLASWGLVCLTGTIIWYLSIFLAAITFGIGLLIGFALAAYFIIKVMGYLFPERLVAYTDSEWAMFVMGSFYCISYLVFLD